MAKLIFGCGYLGLRVAKLWQARGENVVAITRSRDRAAALAAEEFGPLIADITQAETLTPLPAASSALFAVSVDRRAGASPHDVHVTGLGNVLDALAATGTDCRLIYISSTGVYGQTGGEEVDERSPCEPKSESGRACLAAEHLIAAHPLGKNAVVLRMAGLYGPGRVPNADAVREQRPIGGAPDTYLNLIHVDDAAAAVLGANERGKPGGTYNISDGHPVLRREYYEHLARIYRAPPPVFAPENSAASRTGRDATNKRVANTRMQSELRVPLHYQSIREGLAAIAAIPDDQ